MYTYYCKNCKNIVGKWNYKYKYHNIVVYCKFTESKNINSIHFLDCEKCKKFIGIYCHYVCNNCFGKDIILDEKNLFNWFQKYKKIISKNINSNYKCQICNNKNSRIQFWFFKELTFI